MTFPVILTVEIVSPEERDKFRRLSRPDTYHKIRPHERVGERGAYTVEMTEEEYRQALADSLDPDSNLIAAERALPMDSHLVPNQANLDYAGLRRLAENDYDASSVVVAVIDRGISTAFRDAHFAGRIADSSDFTEESDPFSLYGGDPHGCYMSGLAVPPESDLVVAKINLTADVAEALYWLADDTSADVVSISLGTDTPSPALEDAVEYAAGEGLLIFASAGNDGDTTVNYPSSYDGAHKISNFDHRTDEISPDSTYGSDVWAAAGGNDHTLWNASGAEIYLEAGGTSAATAMASRIAAYVVGKFGSGTAISRLEDTARDAGAPSNKQGAGVLQLVKVYDGDPVPVVPSGQPRDFDLVFPELPPIEGPGTGVDPSGSGGSSVCQDELEDLVSALNASPTTANANALKDFIELQTGQPIEDVIPAWGDVIEDGSERTATVEVCGGTLAVTISGTLSEAGGCEHLPTYGLSWPQNDFNLSVVTTDTATFDETGQTPAATVTYNSQPDVSVHLDDPEFVYLGSLTGDADLFIALNERGYSVSLGGISTVDDLYTPFLRVRGSWTCKVGYSVTTSPQFNSGVYTGITHHRYVYRTKFPLMGFHDVLRFSDDSHYPPYPSTSDPVRLGSFDGEGDTANVDSDLANGAPGVGGIASTTSATQAAETDTPADACFWLPSMALGDDLEGGGTAPLEFIGDRTTATGGTQANALADFIAEVEDYQAFAGPYDPVLTFDEEAMEITVSFETDENAMYLPIPSCGYEIDGDAPFGKWAISWGGYWQDLGAGPTPTPGAKLVGDVYEATFPDGWINHLATRILDGYAPDNADYTTTAYRRVLPLAEGDYVPEIEAAETGTSDGRPPDTEPNPPIVPVGGGCRSSIDGPSSCNWNLPDGDIPLPGDNFPDYPVVDVKFPKFPPIGCHFPDFGNMDPCGPGAGPPGHNGPLPGGRDRRGKRGKDHGSVKTGGKSYGNPRKVTFSERTCPGEDLPGISSMTVITMLLMDCGISPIDIIFQVGPEWDKPFPENKCFRKGSRIWDAAEWTARYLGLKIIDEGKPTDNIYVGPPWHRPGQSTWHFYEHWDLFGLDRGSSSDELYGAVEVFGPNGSAISIVDSPFVTPDSPTLLVEVAGNHSQADMDRLAALKASMIRRDAVSVQAVVPYSSEYFLRDKAVTHAPDKGYEENWIIVGKESDISIAGRLHILTLMLPETVRELDELPTSVEDVADEIPGTEYVTA